MMMIDESLIPSTSSSISTNPPTNNISISNSSNNVEQQSTTQTTAKQMQNSDENERKREECLMRVLQKESRFEKLKPKCHKAKQDLFDKFQEAILNRRCDIFQRRKQQLDAEFDVRRKSIQSNRKIRMEMLARRQEGQRQIVLDNFEYEKMQVKRQIGDQIEEKLRAIDEEERRLEANLSEHLSATSSANPTGNASKIAKFQLERPTTNKNAKENGKAENGRRKRKAPIEEEEEEEAENGIGRNGGRLKLWKNVPVVIAKLPDKSIQEDLELFCCVKKERGD